MIWYTPVDAEGYAFDRYSFLTASAAEAHRPGAQVASAKSPASLQRPEVAE